MRIDLQKIKEIISSRYIERIFPSPRALEDALRQDFRLTIYIGIDPTSPYLHLGHTTNFFLLKKFQELGHRVIFLIGDFTAQVGDPTGKDSARKNLTHGEVLQNAKGYADQAGHILDFKTGKNPVEIIFNSKWLSRLTLKEIITLMAKATVGQMIKREMFQKRIKEGREIYLHEFLYPLLQGYDSVAMEVDIEVGGNDQTFNMLVGRDLVKEYLKKEKFVIATKLLVNPKTQKKLMSKSEGNFIGLSENANDMYGKVMALDDDIVMSVFTLCTEVSDVELRQIVSIAHPKEQKERLALKIVAMYHGEKEARNAQEEFARVFSQKKLPSEIKEVRLSAGRYDTLELLVRVGLAHSKSEARRLIEQRGVQINDKPISSPNEQIDLYATTIISKGKRGFIKVRILS